MNELEVKVFERVTVGKEGEGDPAPPKIYILSGKFLINKELTITCHSRSKKFIYLVLHLMFSLMSADLFNLRNFILNWSV